MKRRKNLKPARKIDRSGAKMDSACGSSLTARKSALSLGAELGGELATAVEMEAACRLWAMLRTDLNACVMASMWAQKVSEIEAQKAAERDE